MRWIVILKRHKMTFFTHKKALYKTNKFGIMSV